jgi:hypothetical protein
MNLFLRIETSSNILGSKDKDVIYIAVSQITSIGTDGNGGTVVLYGANNSETRVPDASPDSLISNSVVSIEPSL